MAIPSTWAQGPMGGGWFVYLARSQFGQADGGGGYTNTNITQPYDVGIVDDPLLYMRDDYTEKKHKKGDLALAILMLMRRA